MFCDHNLLVYNPACVLEPGQSWSVLHLVLYTLKFFFYLPLPDFAGFVACLEYLWTVAYIIKACLWFFSTICLGVLSFL